jgi:archaemetzincin
LCVAALFILAACGGGGETANVSVTARDARAAELATLKDAVVPFFRPMHVEHLDWLEGHPEDGQTFAEYAAGNPTLPTAERKTIYIQPIGSFTSEQKKVLQLTADYMTAFYGLPVRLERERPIGTVPKEMTRTVFPNNRQIKTAYFLEGVLPKMLPKDATAFLCFTNFDLFPDPNWSYVFGQASLDGRVGVYSLYRLSDKTKTSTSNDRFLDRTLKVAMHETGHMFSMLHCTKYECLMSGTNHLAETDRRPLDVCPECMAKIAWGLKYDPVERYKKLAAFWEKTGRPEEQKRTLAMAAAVESTKAKLGQN